MSHANRRLPRFALVAGGLGAGILLAPLLAGVVLAPRTGSGRPPDADPADPGAAQFLAGLDRARDGHWDEAREHLAAAARAGVPEAPERLAAVDRRQAAAAVESQVRALLAGGDIAGAARALATAGEGGPGAVDLARGVREAAARRHDELTAALDAGTGDPAEVRAELARLDDAVPGPAQAQVPGSTNERDVPARGPRAPSSLDRALAAFRAGRVAEARALLASCSGARCRDVASGLATVEAALPVDGRSGSCGGPAPSALEAAWESVRRLGGSPPLEKTIGAALSPCYHAAGIAALGRGDLAVARERLDRALAADPGHAASRQERERLRERAKEAFLAGYTEKDASPEQARQKFRLVTTISGPEEEIHRKALRWLGRLDGHED